MQQKSRLCELYLELPVNYTSGTEILRGKCNEAIFCFAFIRIS
jgi:hypothetical protein